mmetsp:Transcript_13609/g.27120  ORF Transcript_13609/g.27120 Transcript_13609/m.27120 type:complete len:89 (-) Transcript_13609:94-360(-)
MMGGFTITHTGEVARGKRDTLTCIHEYIHDSILEEKFPNGDQIDYVGEVVVHIQPIPANIGINSHGGGGKEVLIELVSAALCPWTIAQ